MADGFLAPTGKFYPKTENFHAQTARAILGQDGQTDEPIQELSLIHISEPTRP